MEEEFFAALVDYKTAKAAKDKHTYLASIASNQDRFVQGYEEIYAKVNTLMYGPTVCQEGITPFNQYVGADDGHDDLCDFIIWNGKEATQAFLEKPESAIPLAMKMSKTKGFTGDVNSLKELILLLV